MWTKNKNKENNENWFCEHARVRAFEPHDSTRTQLQSRGNELVFFGVPNVEPFARAAGLDFVPYGEAKYPVGSIDTLYSFVATMRSFEVVRHSRMDLNLDLTRVAFDYLAEKVTTTGVEALVIDTIHFFIELVPLRVCAEARPANRLPRSTGGATTPPRPPATGVSPTGSIPHQQNA